MAADHGWRDPLALMLALGFGVAAGLLTVDRLDRWALLAGAVTGLLVLLTNTAVRSVSFRRAHRGPSDAERAATLLADARRSGRAVPGSDALVAALVEHASLVITARCPARNPELLADMVEARDLLRPPDGDEVLADDLKLMLRDLLNRQREIAENCSD